MKRFVKFFGVALAALTVVMSGVAPVSAQGSLNQGNDGSSGLSITPKKNYVLEPGKSVTDKLSITNLDRQHDLLVTMRPVDFTFMDDTGSPKLILAQDAEPTTWSLKPFMNLPQTVTIPKGGSKTVDMKISVPVGQGAGSYYSAIVYTASGTNGGNVSINASGVTLAFLNIPGVVNEKMSIQKFGAFTFDKSGNTGKYVFIAADKAPDSLSYALKNEGNVAENPSGSIILKNMFGKTVKTFDNANPRGSLALIGQTRRFDACINPSQKKIELENQATAVRDTSCNPPSLMPGRYTASLDVFYGQNGNPTHEITAVASFWYLPLWFIIAVIVAILIIAYIIWRIVRKIKGSDARPSFRLSKKKR